MCQKASKWIVLVRDENTKVDDKLLWPFTCHLTDDQLRKVLLSDRCREEAESLFLFILKTYCTPDSWDHETVSKEVAEKIAEYAPDLTDFQFDIEEQERAVRLFKELSLVETAIVYIVRKMIRELTPAEIGSL